MIHTTRPNLLVSSSPLFDQNHKPDNIPPSVGSDQPEASQQIQPDLSSHDPTCTKVRDQTSDEFKSSISSSMMKSSPEEDGQSLSHSQKDVQNLQNLVELAKEGLTLTQWKLDVDHIQAAEQSGKYWQLCGPCP